MNFANECSPIGLEVQAFQDRPVKGLSQNILARA